MALQAADCVEAIATIWVAKVAVAVEATPAADCISEISDWSATTSAWTVGAGLGGEVVGCSLGESLTWSDCMINTTCSSSTDWCDWKRSTNVDGTSVSSIGTVTRPKFGPNWQPGYLKTRFYILYFSNRVIIGSSVCGSRIQAKDHGERTVRRCAYPTSTPHLSPPEHWS